MKVYAPPISNTDHASLKLHWRNNIPSSEWDSALASLGGHPLQSALWGNAKFHVEGISDERWIAFRGVTPVWMVRVEKRQIPLIGTVGWAPRGPAEVTVGSLSVPDWNEFFRL